MKVTLISLSEIMEDKGHSASAIRFYMLNDDFPLPMLLDDGFIGWVESDVDKWVEIALTNYHPTVLPY